MDDHETQRLLGQLIAKIDSVVEAQKVNEEHATESREKVYRALEGIRSEAQDSKARLDLIENTLNNEVKPVVKGVLDWRSRAIGAATILGFIGTLMVLALTAAKELFLDIWRLMVNR